MGLGARLLGTTACLATIKLHLPTEKPAASDTLLTTQQPFASHILSSITMDIQSLESRFEGISVNDENHDQHTSQHKSKVGNKHCRPTTPFKQQLLTACKGFNHHLELGCCSCRQPTEASSAEAARQCRKELAILCQWQRNNSYHCQDHPSITSCSKAFGRRTSSLGPPGIYRLYSSATIVTQTIPLGHV